MTQDQIKVGYNIVNFKNFGFLQVRFTDKQLKPIIDEIQKIQSNFSLATETNEKLAGHINHEYDLIDSLPYIESLFSPLIREYESIYDYGKEFTMLSDDVPIYLESAWVNFQKKHEFNPLHTHPSVLSFVIWIKIPYSLEDEINYFPRLSGKDSDRGNVHTSKFCFVYVDTLGSIKQVPIPVDSSYEGTIMMFPSVLNHIVYPFYTSDEYRISVSGNIRINVLKEA
jgi:hypothetical protein